MTQKQTVKNEKTAAQKLETLFSHVALGAMALATIVSAIEIPENREVRPLAVLQPAYAVAGQTPDIPNETSESRHLRIEEIRHEQHSYGSTMRSHPTSGTI